MKSPVPSVCSWKRSASEAAIMTLLLPTLERLPLKIVRCHLNYNTGVWGRTCVQPSQPAVPAACTQNMSSSHIRWAGCGNQIRAWAPAVLAELFPKHALEERGHRSARFQLACALRSKQPVSCSTHTLRYISWGRGTGWKLLRKKRTHVCFTSREEQEGSSNRSCSKDGIVHKPATTDTGIKLKLQEKEVLEETSCFFLPEVTVNINPILLGGPWAPFSLMLGEEVNSTISRSTGGSSLLPQAALQTKPVLCTGRDAQHHGSSYYIH